MNPFARLRRGVGQRVEQVLQPWRVWRNRNRDFQPIFIAGAMGSGTSLIASSLWQRFQCGAVAFESARWIDRNSFLHVAQVNSFDSVAGYRAAIEPRQEWSVQEGRGDLLRHYRSLATQPGTVAIDKGPNTNLVRARFLNSCFPKAGWILIFRDPVANVEGFRRKWRTFGQDSLPSNIGFYADIHENFLAALPSLQGAFVAMEYEVLVADFEAMIDQIGARLGMIPASNMRRVTQRDNVEGRGLRSVDAKGFIQVVQNASHQSYDRLSADEIERIKTALGPLHRNLRALT